MPSLEVNIAPRHPSGLVLKNPVITASGTFGYGTEYASIYDVNRLGAIAAKAVTLRPRSGNPMPRIVEVPGGMLNAIGLQNVGAEALIRDKAPIWARWDVPVIANVAGASLEEFVTIAEMLDGAPGIAALELNISCPNVAHGLDFGTDPAMAGAVTQAVSERSSLPLIVKLTPNVTDIRPVATAVAEAGAHALAIMNTLSGLAIDVAQKRPVLATTSGGLSGPAVRSVALRLVYTVAPLVDIPIIGIGGIGTTEDALMFLMAGATAIQVGTANFYNHRAPTDIRPVATAVAEAGAHALAIMNTLSGLAIDVTQKRPVLATTSGGLSGPAVRSIALRLVYTVAPLVDIPIIGIGGIGTTEDALMFLMAGATAIQVGTANFYNHRAPLEIIAGLEAYCAEEGLESIEEIIGAALPQHAAISST